MATKLSDIKDRVIKMMAALDGATDHDDGGTAIICLPNYIDMETIGWLENISGLTFDYSREIGGYLRKEEESNE